MTLRTWFTGNKRFQSYIFRAMDYPFCSHIGTSKPQRPGNNDSTRGGSITRGIFCVILAHTVTLYNIVWALNRLISPVTPWFVQQLVNLTKKETFKTARLPVCEKITNGYQMSLCRDGPVLGKSFKSKLNRIILKRIKPCSVILIDQSKQCMMNGLRNLIPVFIPGAGHARLDLSKRL